MTGAGADAFPIRYAVHGGLPAVDLAVEVAADGAFLLDLLTEASLAQRPPARLGRFAGRLEPALATRLARWAAAAPAPPPGHIDPPGTISRFLARGSEPLQPVVGRGGELAALEAELSAAFIPALADPVAAIQVEARPDAAAGGTLVIRSVGIEPFPLLLFARDIPGYWARIWREEAGPPAARSDLPYETIAALAGDGAIVEGPAPLAPGDTVELPLPEPPPGADPSAAGGFIFWRTGTGPERRIVSGRWTLPYPSNRG